MLKKIKSFVKNLLAIPAVRHSYTALTNIILRVFSAQRLLATLYTTLGFLTFNREQFAVLKGRANYYRNLSSAPLTYRIATQYPPARKRYNHATTSTNICSRLYQ